MKVILNVDAITPPLTGIGHYALQLARGLRCHPAVGELKFFSAYRWVADPEQALQVNQILAQVRKRVPFKVTALHVYNWGRSQLFGWRTRSLRNYILHSPNFILMPFAGPAITTIHDLSYIHYPQHHPRERIAFMERQIPRTLAQATAVVTDSEFVRQELISLLGVSAAKIVTVPLGVDGVFHPRERTSVQTALQQYDLANVNYLLVVATLEPRKNLVRLIEAYSRLTPALRSHYPLVLAGAKGWLNETLEKHLEPLERGGHVRRLGYVPQEILPLLYAGAWAFAFPSLYEGFGLPVLEAMASGVPVMASNCSSLPEVTGKSALLVDPEDVEAMTTGLNRLLTDGEWRSLAVANGISQARRFSWQRCVDETVDLYQRVHEEFYPQKS